MADLIDRQTIIETIHKAIYPFFCGAEDGDILSEDEKLVLSVNKTICTAIKALPSEDAIEVVRCKDCKYFDSGTDEDGKLFFKCLGWVYGGTSEDDFCSHGERKDD